MITPAPPNGGAVDGAVRVWRRLEGIAALLPAIGLYPSREVRGSCSLHCSSLLTSASPVT